MPETPRFSSLALLNGQDMTTDRDLAAWADDYDLPDSVYSDKKPILFADAISEHLPNWTE